MKKFLVIATLALSLTMSISFFATSPVVKTDSPTFKVMNHGEGG